MIDLALFVRDALRNAPTVEADEICVDYPESYEFYDQTTIVISERESTLADEFADPYVDKSNLIYATPIEIHVMAKDRATARRIRRRAETAAMAALIRLVDRDNGPVWAVWWGNKSCGPASLGGVYLGCTGAKREIIVSNSIET